MRLHFLVIAALVGVSLAARADTFAFSFAGPSDNGSGKFTAVTTTTPGEFLITGVYGTVDGLSITSLLAPGIYPVATAGDSPNDNLLFYPGNANTYFDFPGLSFALSSGVDANIFDSGGPEIVFGTPAADQNLDALSSLSVIMTPEPSSLALFGTGLLGFAGFMRKQFC